MSCDPLFVLGIARSGTNLIAGMLNARKDVSIALDPLMPFFKALRSAILLKTGDTALIARYPERAPFQDYYFDPLGVRLLDATMSASLDHPLAADGELAEAVAHRAGLESQTLPEVLSRVRGDNFSAFLSDIIEVVRTRSPSALRWCGAKEVWTTEFIPALARALPRARFIVIRRDPRSVLASLVAMMTRDETQAAHTISYMRHWRKEAAVLDAMASEAWLRERVLIVQYEAVTTAPEQSARDICAFLGLGFDSAMLTPAAADGSASAGNSSFGDMTGIVDTSVTRWRAVIDDEMVRAVECLCGPEMRAEGYETVNNWPILADATVQHAAARADARPGSWRSDSGDVAADLAGECARWDMLSSRNAVSGGEIRRHFLFDAFFEKLRAATPQNRAAAAVGAR
jgi:hypothetical protein